MNNKHKNKLEYTEVEIVEPTSLSLTEVEINSLAKEIQALHPSVSKGGL